MNNHKVQVKSTRLLDTLLPCFVYNQTECANISPSLFHTRYVSLVWMTLAYSHPSRDGFVVGSVTSLGTPVVTFHLPLFSRSRLLLFPHSHLIAREVSHLREITPLALSNIIHPGPQPQDLC